MRKLFIIMTCCFLVFTFYRTEYIAYAQDMENEAIKEGEGLETQQSPLPETLPVPPDIEFPKIEIPEMPKMPRVQTDIRKWREGMPQVPAAPGQTPALAGKMEFKRENAKFVSLDETDPNRRIMAVKNEAGDTVQLELPAYVRVFKFVPVSELKQGEDIIINYRVVDGKNIGITIRAGEFMAPKVGPMSGKAMEIPAPPKPSQSVEPKAPVTTQEETAERENWIQRLKSRIRQKESQ